MSKNEVNLVRTPQDLERKYNLGQIKTLEKNYELQKLGLNKIENETTNILNSIMINLDGLLENQSDISLWFFSGIPTLKTEPSTNWTTDEELENHLGDIYYDKDTGKVYLFKNINNEYIWNQSNSTELMKSMAISNNQVKEEHERKVFFNTPYTPYKNGDWYVKENGTLYICQISRDSPDTYQEKDFIIATKYVDDTVAIGDGDNLTILSGTVTELKKDVNELSDTMTNTTELVDQQGNKIGDLETKTSQTSQTVDDLTNTVSGISTYYTNTEELNQKLEDQKNTIITEMTTQYQQNMNTFTFDILKKINEDGVSTLKNTMVTIDETGINTAKNDEDVVSLLDNAGVYVSDGKKKDDGSNILMKVDRNGGYLKNLEIKNTVKEQDIIQKEKIEDEIYGTCQAWYWIGSDN